MDINRKLRLCVISNLFLLFIIIGVIIIFSSREDKYWNYGPNKDLLLNFYVKYLSQLKHVIISLSCSDLAVIMCFRTCFISSWFPWRKTTEDLQTFDSPKIAGRMNHQPEATEVFKKKISQMLGILQHNQ